MKTIGTLKEIGAKVGDTVEYTEFGSSRNRVIASDIPNAQGFWMASDGYEMGQDSPYWRIVIRAARSPVRTVTRKEIVPGIYGRLQVSSDGYHAVNISAKDPGISWSASDLTAAIKTLTEIRDAMQEST